MWAVQAASSMPHMKLAETWYASCSIAELLKLQSAKANTYCGATRSGLGAVGLWMSKVVASTVCQQRVQADAFASKMWYDMNESEADDGLPKTGAAT